MTDDFNEFEKLAAIKLCELRGQDPEETIRYGDPGGLAVCLYSPRWKLTIGEVRAYQQVRAALDLAEGALLSDHSALRCDYRRRMDGDPPAFSDCVLHAGHSGEHSEMWRYDLVHGGEWLTQEAAREEVRQYHWEGRQG